MDVVSIIIPVFNRKDLLIDTLKSVTKQTYPYWECIVVDDHSTDGTFEYARIFFKNENRIKFFRRPLGYPKGAPSCRNFGFEKAIGTYIQFFDSDDLMKENMIEKKIESLKGDPAIDFSVAKMGYFIDGGYDYVDEEYDVSSDSPVRDILNGTIKFFTPGPIYRYSMLKDINPLFDTRLERNQEGELHARLLLQDFSYREIDEYLCYRRLHKDSIKSKSDRLGKLGVRRHKINMYVCLNENTDYLFSRKILLYKRKYFLKTFLLFLINFDIKYSFLLLKLVSKSL